MAKRDLPLWQSAALRVVLGAGGLAATIWPRAFELAAAPALGRLLMLAARKRRMISVENIRRCLPELGEAERSELLKRNFAHWGLTAFELLHLFSPLPGHYRRYAGLISVMEGFEHWKAAHAKGKGVVFASTHLGSWEMLAAAGGLRGIPITIVTRDTRPLWLKRKVEASRLEAGVKAVYQPRTMPTVIRRLRAGEAVGFVIDQYAAPPMGLPVRFFGYKVDTLAAIGPLAKRTGAAILPASTYRDASGLVHVVIRPELDLGEAVGDAERATQTFAAWVEARIREYPEQWTWGHRRFKNVDWSDRTT